MFTFNSLRSLNPVFVFSGLTQKIKGIFTNMNINEMKTAVHSFIHSFIMRRKDQVLS